MLQNGKKLLSFIYNILEAKAMYNHIAHPLLFFMLCTAQYATTLIPRSDLGLIQHQNRQIRQIAAVMLKK